MRHFLNKLILPVLCAALLWAAVVPAWAHEVPDLKKTGSITLTLQYDGKPLSGGSFALYRVGTVTEKDGDYSFTTAGTGFSAFSGSLDKQDAALAQKLKGLCRLPEAPAGGQRQEQRRQGGVLQGDAGAVSGGADPALYGL